MELSYGLEKFEFKISYDKFSSKEGEEPQPKEGLQMSLSVTNPKTNVSISVEEIIEGNKHILNLRNAFVSGAKELVPIFKDAIIEVGKTLSNEVERHTLLHSKIRKERKYEKDIADITVPGSSDNGPLPSSNSVVPPVRKDG